MREIVFDTETTGLSVAEGHRIVEIGCIELFNKVETGNSFHCYFNPERTMPAQAEAVHGLSDRFLSDKPLFPSQARALLDFLGDSPMIAHNANFDFTFLNWELGACGHATIDLGRMVDTQAIARRVHPGGKLTLDALCSRYGIDRSHRVKHGALLDAQLLAQLYVELTGGRQIGLSLKSEELVPIEPIRITLDRIPEPVRAVIRPARPHMASEEELERHRIFIAAIKDALWMEGVQA